MVSNGRVTENEELEKIWKEAAEAYFKVLFKHLPGGAEENHRYSQWV
jgi:hypothetical protein